MYEHIASKLQRGETIILDGGTGTDIQRPGAPMSGETWCAEVAASRGWPDDRLRTVRDVFEQELEQVQVFRIGRPSSWGLVGAIDVFVYGRTADGALVGVHTVSVET